MRIHGSKSLQLTIYWDGKVLPANSNYQGLWHVCLRVSRPKPSLLTVTGKGKHPKLYIYIYIKHIPLLYTLRVNTKKTRILRKKKHFLWFLPCFPCRPETSLVGFNYICTHPFRNFGRNQQSKKARQPLERRSKPLRCWLRYYNPSIKPNQPGFWSRLTSLRPMKGHEWWAWPRPRLPPM